jgi:hypothetical protein
LNQIRSSRRLEREAERNVEVLWLLGRITPSFKTIADFRRDHSGAIVEVCRAFIDFCGKQSLLGSELVAIDGTKINAAASRSKVITPEKLAKRSKAVEGKIAEHLAAMDKADTEESTTATPQLDVAEALAALKQKREEIRRQAEDLAANAQIAVDSRNKLIVAFDLTNEGNDTQQLHPMAEKAKEALGTDSLTVVADTGYSSGEQGERCEKAQITAIVPRPERGNTAGEEFFDRSRFAYDRTSDTYRCPAGQTLALEGVSRVQAKRSYANPKACGSCALKPQCTKAKHRRVNRSFFEDAIDAMHQRALADPKWMARRRDLAEHPFGTIKAMMGLPRFLLRGIQKAKAEWALSVLCYNLRRVTHILGAQSLLLSFLQVAA